MIASRRLRLPRGCVEIDERAGARQQAVARANDDREAIIRSGSGSAGCNFHRSSPILFLVAAHLVAGCLGHRGDPRQSLWAENQSSQTYLLAVQGTDLMGTWEIKGHSSRLVFGVPAEGDGIRTRLLDPSCRGVAEFFVSDFPAGIVIDPSGRARVVSGSGVDRIETDRDGIAREYPRTRRCGGS